jgi:hypothetical protein
MVKEKIKPQIELENYLKQYIDNDYADVILSFVDDIVEQALNTFKEEIQSRDKALLNKIEERITMLIRHADDYYKADMVTEYNVAVSKANQLRFLQNRMEEDFNLNK